MGGRGVRWTLTGPSSSIGAASIVRRRRYGGGLPEPPLRNSALHVWLAELFLSLQLVVGAAEPTQVFEHISAAPRPRPPMVDFEEGAARTARAVLAHETAARRPISLDQPPQRFTRNALARAATWARL